jgi:hypothetical protein
MPFVSDDSQGARTKATWTTDPNNPTGDPSKYQDGGWYLNKDTGYVERWFNTLPSSSENTSSSNAINNLTSVSSTGASNTSLSLPQAPKIDLQAEYTRLYDELGLAGMKDSVKKAQQEILLARAQADQALSLSNENPFLSEAGRIGRQAKIEEAYNAKAQVLSAQATLKQQEYQDAQNNLWQQMDLAEKQYQYDYSAYQDNLNQMNYLLEAGALNDADEASLEMMAATAGISTSMLRSMINAQKQKNYKPTLVQNVDDNGNVTLTLVDANTGNIINQQRLEGVEASNMTKYNQSSSSSSSSYGGYSASQAANIVNSAAAEEIRQIAQDNVAWAKKYGGQTLDGDNPFLWQDQAEIQEVYRKWSQDMQELGQSYDWNTFSKMLSPYLKQSTQEQK